MSATIKVFNVGTRCFKHVMISDHNRTELRDEHDRPLLTYGEDDKVFGHSGGLGKLHIDYHEWIYCEMPSATCVVLGPDLPLARIEVSKRYIEQRGLLAA